MVRYPKPTSTRVSMRDEISTKILLAIENHDRLTIVVHQNVP